MSELTSSANDRGFQDADGSESLIAPQKHQRQASPDLKTTARFHEPPAKYFLPNVAQRVDTGASIESNGSLTRPRGASANSHQVPADRRTSLEYDEATGSHLRDSVKWAEEAGSLPERVEARFNWIEERIRRLSTERSSDPDGSDSRGYLEKPPPPQSGGGLTTPILRAMPWYEWVHTKSSWDEDSPYIIDILAEDSVLVSEVMRKESRKAPPDETTRAELLDKLIKTKSQPERIRINSWYLQRFLELVSGNDRLAPLDRAFVLLRPFKILKYHENSLKDEYERLKQHWDSSDGTNDHSDEDHESIDCQQSFLDLGCLIKFIDDFVTPMYFSSEEEIPGMIPHSKLWFLLRPGSLVYSKDRKVPQKVWKVISRTGGRKFLSRPENLAEGRTWQGKYSKFVVHCYRLDHDGNEFVRVEKEFSIDYFDGVQPLTSLPLFPLHAAEKDGWINRQDLVARGELFVDCITRKFRDYSGRSHWCTPDGEKLINPDEGSTGVPFVISETIESQVMIDFRRTLQTVPEWRPVANELNLYNTEPAEMREEEVDEQETIEKDTVWDGRLREDFVESESAKMRDWAKPGHHPAGEDLLLLPDRVFGFVFRSRKWACLQLRTGVDGEGDLQPVATKSEGWDDLKLSGDHKNIIQSLMSSHFEKNGAIDLEFDLVKNKGKSMVILLHGPPGVGKTSTAECVAEYYRKPLLPITCGDLGLSAQEVENKLQSSFQLAQAWNCVLLLDEADIFLAQRTTSDIKRNALVSVFLRVLEYYEGILFLTTNRIGSFDEAFKSRCHMALYYPALSLGQTKAIWESHVDRAHRKLAGTVEVDKEDVLDYAEELWNKQSSDKRLGPVWNGRQIRNAFQSALALARYEVQEGKKVALKIKYLKRVADVSSDFSEYLFKTHAHRNDADRMRSNHLRDDHHGRENLAPQSGLTTYLGMNDNSPSIASPLSAPQSFGHLPSHQPQTSASGQHFGVPGMSQYQQSPPAHQHSFPLSQSTFPQSMPQAPPTYATGVPQQNVPGDMSGMMHGSMASSGFQSPQGQPGPTANTMPHM